MEAILASISDAFFALDRAWRFTYLNDHAWEEFPLALGTTFEREYRHAMERERFRTVQEASPNGFLTLAPIRARA
ncbi:hypothetical protein J421_1902 [Gemmatirosa kalamazoonensis]|uniref:PAS domain-containing protein n=1 Tax=Gemmatirosa kalamazoonensis TaxID=861299 RepID=W0REA8_9BACT|nr:PAS domain-containing protein [Gemmatirosa kalamazoonensis]AHG89439.1 hypothetical protein J421_1902 [Gemmatirosa kalamazoonensis]